MEEAPGVINLDEILDAADRVFASAGLAHELAVMELRSAVTTFRVQQTQWSKSMKEYLKARKAQEANNGTL